MAYMLQKRVFGLPHFAFTNKCSSYVGGTLRVQILGTEIQLRVAVPPRSPVLIHRAKSGDAGS